VTPDPTRRGVPGAGALGPVEPEFSPRLRGAAEGAWS